MMTVQRVAIVCFVILWMPGALLADGTEAGARTVYVLRSSVMGAAGTHGASTGFLLDGTLGQPTPPGTGVSENFDVIAGFWGARRVATAVPGGIVPDLFRNALLQNIPNPFNPVTTIGYEVGVTAPVEIAIYSVQGRLVRKLLSESKSPGRYEAVWNGRDASGGSAGSGVYLYRLQVGQYSSVKKMILIK
jgi:hypothetical protein